MTSSSSLVSHSPVRLLRFVERRQSDDELACAARALPVSSKSERPDSRSLRLDFLLLVEFMQGCVVVMLAQCWIRPSEAIFHSNSALLGFLPMLSTQQPSEMVKCFPGIKTEANPYDPAQAEHAVSLIHAYRLFLVRSHSAWRTRE